MTVCVGYLNSLSFFTCEMATRVYKCVYVWWGWGGGSISDGQLPVFVNKV